MADPTVQVDTSSELAKDQPLSTSQSASGAPQRYRCSLELAKYPLGKGEAIVYSPDNRAKQILTSWPIRMLEICTQFAPLEAQALSVCRELGFDAMQLPGVRQQLQDFVESGMLLSHSALLERCKQNVESKPPAIASLGVPTRNRPDSLERCLTSYLECAREFDRSISVVVADGSTTAAIREENIHVIEEMKRRYGAECFYVGEQQKQELAHEIARRGELPVGLVEFVLLNPLNCPLTTGTNRNALLLSTVGELTVQVDDDTLCRLAPSCGLKPGITLTSRGDPTGFWCFGEDEDETLTDRIVREDFFGQHEQLLGKTLGSCLESYAPEEVDLNGAKSFFFKKLKRADARVLATALGCFGDSGLGAFVKFLTLEGEAREGLFRSEAVYRYALTTKRVMRASRRPSITEGDLCMGINLGLDNRGLLPPFSPVQRNQDGVFGALLRSRSGYYGYLPWMVQHQAPTDRQLSSEQLWERAGIVGTGDILYALVNALMPKSSNLDADNVLQTLGKSFVQWGQMAPGDFEEILSSTLWRGASGHIQQMEAILDMYADSPDFWKKDVNAYLGGLRAAVSKDDFIKPVDLRDEFGHDHALTMLQRIISRFGEVLQVWPAIIATMQQMRQTGWRPGIKI